MEDVQVEMARAAARDAALRLVAWNDVAAWLGYAALEFVKDEQTRGYLLHVGECVRDEGERRYARRAGVEPVPA